MRSELLPFLLLTVSHSTKDATLLTIHAQYMLMKELSVTEVLFLYIKYLKGLFSEIGKLLSKRLILLY